MKFVLPKQSAFTENEEALLTMVLDSLVGGVIVIDDHKRVIIWNDWMKMSSGIEVTQAKCRGLFELFPQLAGSRIEQSVDDCLVRGNASLLSHALMRESFPLVGIKNQEPIQQVIYIKPVMPTGKRRHCIVQIADVTAAVKREHQLRSATSSALSAQQAAEELAALKSGFISVVSHELRTPLTSIRGSLSLVSNGVVGAVPKKVHDLLQVADRNAGRLLALISDILDMDKFESGKMKFDFQRMSVRSLLEQAVEGNDGYARAHCVSFDLFPIADDLYVSIDDNRMLQVMSNLMSNAAKYEPSGGVVELSVAKRGKHVRISVVDHGPGIPEKFKSRMFEKFSQADTGDTRKLGGTGLGLVISKAIVESHNGVIGFYSDPNRRTEFYIDLPIVP